MKVKLFIASTIMLVSSALFRVLEIKFYGDIGPDGVLQESLFLPLSFIFFALAIVLYLLLIIKWIRTKIRS
ncbi:DUF3955 domain-containing protein [Vibrio sp. 99-8-1]|uniref:DUF3955 domain-containing protein n=1 Tax=Vibrio sp. 99-8-1 TaxID=2607602 RepID=UPI001493CC77|nr:DUF3955 domain-containing protein [Vibrio sp. 99-8-1]NOI66885.1 DUF3955 domain-containing protein [Vibrio sp. 99-8-1]